jgi:hypothetical protein
MYSAIIEFQPMQSKLVFHEDEERVKIIFLNAFIST